MIHKRISHLRGSLLYVSLVYRQTASVKVEAEAFEFDDFAGQTFFEFGVLPASASNICIQHTKLEDIPANANIFLPPKFASQILLTTLAQPSLSHLQIIYSQDG